MVHTFKSIKSITLAALAVAVAVIVCGLPIPGHAAGATASGQRAQLPDCFAALRHSHGPRLVCQHHVWMTDEERADLTRLTRGTLLDAHCTVSVDVERRLVDDALAATDRAITVPPQPVQCDLQTSSGPMTVGGTFAPRVTFKGGVATQSSPGLAHITGVNGIMGYLAVPVVAYINHAPGITSEMVAMINALRSELAGRQAQR